MASLLCSQCGQPMGDFSDIDVRALGPTEFGILDALIRGRHRFLSIQQLVHHVYSHRVDGGPENAANTIRVTMTRMRKKLEAAGWTIENRWAVGFRLARLDEHEKAEG